ncbi:hypothetical protein [Rhodococcus sp. ARC_M6]|nr:hypothetical protein [Rhodococcus sp. ARC_M6]MCJ0905436.1 hypothetical protein [Rhodococcus sp. ARC_M6]
MSSDSVGTQAGNGNRLRCNVCGSEAIVTKAGGSALTCCGQSVEITFGA